MQNHLLPILSLKMLHLLCLHTVMQHQLQSLHLGNQAFLQPDLTIYKSHVHPTFQHCSQHLEWYCK